MNLVSELELRLTGGSVSPGLDAEIGSRIELADSFVLVLFDGLGYHQLAHPAFDSMRSDAVAKLLSPFPATTTVSLATVASGLPASRHGLIGYQMWLPELEVVANTIKWTTLWGDPVEYETSELLPSPNLWERLTAAGIEPVTVQPGHLIASKLSQALYRGCRIEPAFSIPELVKATLDLSAEPGRFVFTYVPHVDFAAHVFGQDSPGYDEAAEIAAGIWDELSRNAGADTGLVGTSDHGHIDFPPDKQVRIPKQLEADLVLYGDSRAMFVKGDGTRLASELPARWVPISEARNWWGPGPAHASFEDRLPDGILLADDGYLLLHTHSDKRLIGNHGGFHPHENEIPLLLG